MALEPWRSRFRQNMPFLFPYPLPGQNSKQDLMPDDVLCFRMCKMDELLRPCCTSWFVVRVFRLNLKLKVKALWPSDHQIGDTPSIWVWNGVVDTLVEQTWTHLLAPHWIHLTWVLIFLRRRNCSSCFCSAGHLGALWSGLLVSTFDCVKGIKCTEQKYWRFALSVLFHLITSGGLLQLHLQHNNFGAFTRSDFDLLKRIWWTPSKKKSYFLGRHVWFGWWFTGGIVLRLWWFQYPLPRMHPAAVRTLCFNEKSRSDYWKTDSQDLGPV